MRSQRGVYNGGFVSRIECHEKDIYKQVGKICRCRNFIYVALCRLDGQFVDAFGLAAHLRLFYFAIVLYLCR